MQEDRRAPQNSATATAEAHYAPIASELDLALKGNDDTMHGKYLTFWTDNQLYGVPIADVVQIIGVQEITTVPEFPDYAKGIINLRGSIIPVIDIRIRLRKNEVDYNERTCIIVTSINEAAIGFIVDAVDEVTSIDDENIAPPPRVSKNYENAYITGIGKLTNKVVLLLDTTKILKEDELDELAGISK